jgi:hypothetical protein
MPKCKIIGAPTKKAMVGKRRRRRRRGRRDRIALAGDASRNHGVVRGELSEVSFHKVRKVVELPRVESNGVEAAMSEKSLGLLTPSYATLLLVLFQ